MIKIAHSVGKNGINAKPDVLTIQTALNKIKPPLAIRPLVEDGIYGNNTANAITTFQKKHVMLRNPDGRIDPGGRTINKLTQMTAVAVAQQGIIFPLNFKPVKSYKSGMRAFGSNRSNGKRKHAGVDLYAAKGTPIRSIKDGKVIQHYKFYLGTYALEIDHGDMLVR